MNDVHLLHQPGEKERLLDRGVTAAYHATSLSLKKAPSQVAQYETPRPMSRCSPSAPSMVGSLPVAIMSA